MQHVETRIHVSDLKKITAFYEAALKPARLGIVAEYGDNEAVGFGDITWKPLKTSRPLLILVDTKVPLMKVLTPKSTKRRQAPKIELEGDDEADPGLMVNAYRYQLERDKICGEYNVSRDVHIHFETVDKHVVDDFEKIVRYGSQPRL